MWQRLLDLVFPRRSLTGQDGAWITREERRELRSFPVRIEVGVLRRQGIGHLDRLAAAGTFAGAPLMRTALHTFKYGRVRELDEDLAVMMLDALCLLALAPGSVLCPVPLHPWRRAWRGFNQSELLAQAVARYAQYEVSSLLRRRIPTGHQARRNRRERRQAMEGVFVARGPVPPHIILVDDVCTSGSTLDACAKALKDAGARTVQALVVASALS